MTIAWKKDYVQPHELTDRLNMWSNILRFTVCEIIYLAHNNEFMIIGYEYSGTEHAMPHGGRVKVDL